jgi:hypothetical protein
MGQINVRGIRPRVAQRTDRAAILMVIIILYYHNFLMIFLEWLREPTRKCLAEVQIHPNDL